MIPEYEHLHAMINHVPIIGVAFVCVLLTYSLIRNERHTLLLSLGILIVLAIMASVTMWTGEEANNRFMFSDIAPMLDEPGVKWINEHNYRAERAAFTTYVIGVLAIGGYVLLWKKPKSLRAIAATMLVLCLLNSLLYAWTANAGGKIRHPEFRETPQAVPPVERAAEGEDH